MGNLFIILLLLISPSFIPDVINPPEYLLFPKYGFEQNDSEKFVPFLNLLKTGAYQVEEFMSVSSNGKLEKERDAHINFVIHAHGDSVIMEKYYVGADTELERKNIYYRAGDN